MVSAVPRMSIGDREIGADLPPLVIPEIGINHEGDMAKAARMIDDAAAAGAEVVKLQSHDADHEMIPNDVVPGNATEPIWDIIDRCTLTADEERQLKEHAERLGLIFLSTPFSREAADRLEGLGVPAFKIGSGECNNLPLIDHIAAFGRPVILSTGMNDMASIGRSVDVLRSHRTPYALLHCTSLYPTPRTKVRLGALAEMREAFPDAVLGLSDHTLTNHVALAAVALGASILERHFTSDRSWPGPDIEISMTPPELADLVQGSRWVHEALGGAKGVLAEEQPTIDFAYSCVVTVRDVAAGRVLTADDLWVKRPGTGEILAAQLDDVIGRRSIASLPRGHQVRWADLAADA